MKNLFKAIGIMLAAGLVGVMFFQLLGAMAVIEDVKTDTAYYQGRYDQIYSEMRDDEKAIADVFGAYVGGYAMGFRKSLEESGEVVIHTWAYRDADGTIMLNYDCENDDCVVTLRPIDKSV